jgi:NTE family protein
MTLSRHHSPRSPAAAPTPTAQNILVLQGGGALGAYQAGVYEALHETGQPLHWVAGISIGAINAALIVGNPPDRRLARLQEFWNLVSSGLPSPFFAIDKFWRETLNEFSASQVMAFGVPGFFKPRMPPAPLQPPGSAGAISYYDTAPLRETLERLVDFDLINNGPIRLSVGAVNVRNGNFQYFDSTKQKLDARHIMASGALPPGFAPVEIDGEHYWDGGLVSNTPLQYVLDEPGAGHRTVLQVDLFASKGEMPTNLIEVSGREKDIRFSSRTRLNTDTGMDWQIVAQATKRLLAKLPPELANDPDVQTLSRIQCTTSSVDVVHLIYRTRHYESQSKDYEFSSLSMRDHWQSGRADMAHTLHDPRWTQRSRPISGVRVFDLNADRPSD